MRHVPHPRAAAPCLQRVRPNDTPHTSHASEPAAAAAAACGAHVWVGVQGTTGGMRKRTQSQGESRQKAWTCPVEGCKSGPCRKDKLYGKGGEAAPWPGACSVGCCSAGRGCSSRLGRGGAVAWASTPSHTCMHIVKHYACICTTHTHTHNFQHAPFSAPPPPPL